MPAFLKVLDDRMDSLRELNDKAEKLSESDRQQLDRRSVRLEESTTKFGEAIEAFHKKMIAKGNNPQVIIDTSAGPIRVELYESLAPITVKNFLQYTDEKHYDGTMFHRVIPTFMIQGGGFGRG